MLLNAVVAKWSINIPDNQVMWGEKFKRVLREKDVSDYLSLYSLNEEEWFKNLKKARNHVSHDERPGVCGSYDDSNLLWLHFCIPGLDDRKCLFEECNLWINNMFHLSKIIKYRR